MDLRATQAPIKESYKADPDAARVHLTARASESDMPTNCSVDIGRAIYAAQAHTGVGGPGTAACSGDLLLGALAACAQVTCQMVAAATGTKTTRIDAIAEGVVDLRGTLGLSREAPVGFESITLRLEIEAPGEPPERIEALREKTERYCTVLQTLKTPPPVRGVRPPSQA